MTSSGSGAKPLPLRSSQAAVWLPRRIWKCAVGPLVFNWNVGWETPNAPRFRSHGRAGWVYFRRKWSIAWWSMYSPWRGVFSEDHPASEDRTESEAHHETD